MYKLTKRALLLAIAAITLQANASGPSNISALNWMAGSWAGTFQGKPMEAQYSAADGGLILGYTKIINGNQSDFFEFEKFEVVDGTLELTPYPFGKQGVSFPIKTISATKAVFENLQHDFPTRIIYELKENGQLFARIEGHQNGQFVFENFIFNRVK